MLSSTQKIFVETEESQRSEALLSRPSDLALVHSAKEIGVTTHLSRLLQLNAWYP